MATRQKTRKNERRDTELKAMLTGRRDQLVKHVHGKIRDVRVGSDTERDVPGAGEILEVDVREDLDLALIEMKSETVRRIDVALDHLARGTYGNCTECGREIAEARLRALPFAVRCRDCEELSETAVGRRTSGKFPDLDLP